ncbi:hypothetical protein BGZ94_009347 [Podila epigama]|nr:hypothetical protein BGZ94_009347 [Podila epigama]
MSRMHPSANSPPRRPPPLRSFPSAGRSELPNPFQDDSPPRSPTFAPPVAADTIAAPSTGTRGGTGATVAGAGARPKTVTASNHSHNYSASRDRTTIPSEPRASLEQKEHNVDDNHNTTMEQEDSMRENPLILLTKSQREAAVENLEIETLDRVQKLRASIKVLVDSLKFRGELELTRMPTSIRSMTVEEYWLKYNGSAREYLRQQTKVKTEANTAFLHATGMNDQKRKREPSESSREFWDHNKRNRDDGVSFMALLEVIVVRKRKKEYDRPAS